MDREGSERRVSDEERDGRIGSRRSSVSALWARMILIFAGLASWILSTRLQDLADTPLEGALAPWVQALGLLMTTGGAIWVVFDILSQRERDRAKRIIDGGTQYALDGEYTTNRPALNGQKQDEHAAATSMPDRFAARQERMLEDSYVQGITQARLIFWVSIVFLCLGALILLGGASSAILSGGNKGKVEAGIVAAVAGTVSSLLSGTFLYQANRSRDSVIDQAARMQARTMADRRIAVVREIAESIEGSDERTRAKQDLLGALIGSLDRLDYTQKTDLPPAGRRRSTGRRGDHRVSAGASNGETSTRED